MLAGVLEGANPFDPASYGRNPAVFDAHRDGHSSSVSVVHRGTGTRSLRIDGFEAATDARIAGYMAMMSHLPLLLHPAPERVLVICFGTGTTAATALLHPGTRADVVDIEPVVFEFAPLFAHVNRGIASDARARLVVDDGRNYLLTTREAYDVITAEPMPPNFAGVVNLYSREYYELARERLRPGGVVVQWLPFHLVTPEEGLDILRTVQSVFPETTLWVHGGTGIVVARRDAPVALDPVALRARFAVPDVARDLRSLSVPALDDFAALHVLGADGVRAATSRAKVISDGHPSLEFHPFRHKTSPLIGIYRPRQLESLDLLYRLRRDDLPRIAGATEAEADRLARQRRIHTELVLAHVYRAQGRPAEAQRALEAGLALAPDAPLRAWTFVQLARLARDEGRIREAGQLLDQGLELAPDDAEARLLQAELAVDLPAARGPD
jgi:spermidine synthase